MVFCRSVRAPILLAGGPNGKGRSVYPSHAHPQSSRSASRDHENPESPRTSHRCHDRLFAKNRTSPPRFMALCRMRFDALFLHRAYSSPNCYSPHRHTDSMESSTHRQSLRLTQSGPRDCAPSASAKNHPAKFQPLSFTASPENKPSLLCCRPVAIHRRIAR